MGIATLIEERAGIEVSTEGRRVDDARLAELVSVLSGCSMLRAVQLVQATPRSDPLDAVAASLCALLPRRRSVADSATTIAVETSVVAR